MKTAVITPYCKEDLATLRRCHLSVRDQYADCRYFLVADGFANETAQQWDCEHISLSKPHCDNGNTPRGIGALSAINQGFEAIFFLDADNWYCPNHVSEGLRLKTEDPDIDIAVLGRHIVLPDGTSVPPDPEDENKSHVDTSCYAFFESSFGLLPLWAMMPTFLGPICDRIMLFAAQSKQYRLAWSPEKTCYFVSNYRSHYVRAQRTPPANTNDSNMAEITALHNKNGNLFKARTGFSLFLNFTPQPTSQKPSQQD